MDEKKVRTKPSLAPYIGLPIVLAVMLLLRAGNTDTFVLLLYGIIIVFGYIASIVDLKTKRIPNGLIVGMLAAWALAIIPKLFYDTEYAVKLMTDSAIGFALGGGLFLSVYLLSRKGLGGGDVKFMAASGLYLGYGGTIQAMLFGTVIAALVGLTLLAMKRINRGDKIPLAQFLYVGFIITLFIQ